VSPTSVALQSGQSKQFEATVTGSPNIAVTWTAVLGSVSSSGLYAAPTVTGQSSDTVSAISVADSSKSASGSVTVTSATSETVGVSVSPTSVALQSGQSKQFEATVTGTPNTAVTWTAVLGSVGSSGLYAAPTVTSQSSDTVSAISVADSSKSASGSVTVTSATSVVGVSVSPTSVALQSGQSQQFAAAVTGTSNIAVTWTATLGSITSSGLYTAPTVTSQISDTVSAVSVADSSKYASESVTVTIGISSGAAYSLNANSVTTKPLPSDVLSHCYGNTSNCAAGDAIAKCAMTDCGGLSELGNPTYMGSFTFASPGNSDEAMAFYYCDATCPWYSVQAATPTGWQTVTFHAPSGALFPEGVEYLITVWDQATGNVFEVYSCCGPQTGAKLPVASGCGSTSATACSITGFTYKSIATNLFTAQDYLYHTTAASSGQFAPAAAMVRHAELQSGVIKHALLFTVDCVNAVNLFVFPGYAPALGVCGTGSFGAQNVNRPAQDQLLFCDYTPTQIASFNLPVWQVTLLTAFCTYGGYIDITITSGYGLNLNSDEEIESGEAWKYSFPSTFLTADPFWAWTSTQTGFNGVQPPNGTKGCIAGSGTNPSTYRCLAAFLTNIPRTVGPEGTDSEGNSCTVSPGCYPSGHIHVADKCIAEGYAGIAGGCS
jgi:hypothetical protein